METLDIDNPFGAPVFYKKTVTSTMDEARSLASEQSGAVIAADEQTLGRGRSGRPWAMNRGENLSFTVVLKFGSIEAIPPAITLRTGLAAALGVEDFVPALAGRVLVKWPNDVMIAGLSSGGGDGGQVCLAKKAVGILTEADGGNVYIGIGVNVAQLTFPPELAEKACSIAQVLSCSGDAGAAALAERRFELLENILFRLRDELHKADSMRGGDVHGGANAVADWRPRLEEKLYMKGRRVRFIPGLPEELARGTAPVIEGTLRGLGEAGEIRITRDTGEIVSFAAGELRFFSLLGT